MFDCLTAAAVVTERRSFKLVSSLSQCQCNLYTIKSLMLFSGRF